MTDIVTLVILFNFFGLTMHVKIKNTTTYNKFFLNEYTEISKWGREGIRIVNKSSLMKRRKKNAWEVTIL